MPIYEYKCNKCGFVFEQLVLGTDEDQGYACPTCGDNNTCKLMSSFSCKSESNVGTGGLSSSCSSPTGGFS